ncbi:MAG: DUF86 domain-containing protein [Bacteroidales bacterium]|nr:DUF86 domain-containing protein [Bacteroidales bacterium]
MRGNLGDKIRIKHILDAISEIELYVSEVDFDSFINDSKTRFASIKQIEIIGEAANHISEESKNKFSEIEWVKITGLRHILVHEYFGVDINIIWGIIIMDIPKLKIAVKKVLDILENN